MRRQELCPCEVLKSECSITFQNCDRFLLKSLFMKNLLLVICLLPIIVSAQAPTGFMYMPQKAKWSLFSFDVNAGYRWFFKEVNRPSQNDYLENKNDLAAPNSNMYGGVFYPAYRERSNVFNANVSFTPGQEQRTLSFGVGFLQNSYRFGRSLFDVQTTSIDTFQLEYSNGTTSPVILDSIWKDREYLHLEQRFVTLSSEYVFRTERSRLSGYAGLGAQFGISVNKTLGYSREQSWNYQYVDSQGNPILQNPTGYNTFGTPIYDDITIDRQSTELDAKRVFMIAPYIPIGVEFSPINRGVWYNGVCIELKGKIGSEFHLIKDAKTYIRPFYSVGIGLKYILPEKHVLHTH